MAVAIPIIAAFASAGTAIAAAGGIAAALGTVTGFLAVGGAALTAVGAITKNSKLTKIGAIMGVAGGLGSAFSAVGAASDAGAAAAQEAANSSWSAGGQAEVAGGAGAGSLEAGSTSAASTAANGAATAPVYDATPTLPGAGSAQVGAPPSAEPALASRALQLQTPGVLDTASASPLQVRAQGLTLDDVNAAARSAASKAGDVLGQAGTFARNNKELLNMGGSVLNSMYGPEAEKMDLLRARDAFDQSIYRRRLANLNSPVRLTNGG
jgi:hypothetical protein